MNKNNVYDRALLPLCKFSFHIVQKNLRIVFATVVSFSTDDDDVDFENSRLGMWKNSYIDNLEWQFHSGKTQTIDTGPTRDHTSGSGKEYSGFQWTMIKTK